jgi:hypothetical protein
MNLNGLNGHDRNLIHCRLHWTRLFKTKLSNNPVGTMELNMYIIHHECFRHPQVMIILVK